MAKARKDDRGRALRKGEVQRASDKRYMYTYTDPLGRRKFIYANDLVELREKEKKLVKDQMDGLDLYVAGKATVNDTFDRYLSTKFQLRETTRSNYIYMYDKYVRETFGKKKIADIKYSDVLQYYLYLLNEEGLALSTLDNINTLLHPTFQLAVRDEIIRKNPSDDIMKEIANPDYCRVPLVNHGAAVTFWHLHLWLRVLFLSFSQSVMLGGCFCLSFYCALYLIGTKEFAKIKGE